MEEIRGSIKRKETSREPYKTASMELDPAEARKKIDLACQAILQRIDELAGARELAL